MCVCEYKEVNKSYISDIRTWLWGPESGQFESSMDRTGQGDPCAVATHRSDISLHQLHVKDPISVCNISLIRV